MSDIKIGDLVKLTDRWTATGKVFLGKYPYPPTGCVGRVAFIDAFYWCTFAGYPDGDKNLWAAHGYELEAMQETDELARLQAENARLRDALEAIARCPVSSGEHGYMVMLYEARRALGIPTPYDNLTDDDIGDDGF